MSGKMSATHAQRYGRHELFPKAWMLQFKFFLFQKRRLIQGKNKGRVRLYHHKKIVVWQRGVNIGSGRTLEYSANPMVDTF